MSGPAAGLTGRRSERGVLDRFVAGVRAGEGRALVVRGEPGVGKTALLDYLARRASGCLVVRAAGVQSEMELAFAGLHQLCAPMLDHAESLPVPQREALRTAFGLSTGPVPDRFLVGLAVLGLLSETAEERPLVCVVDDARPGPPRTAGAGFRSQDISAEEGLSWLWLAERAAMAVWDDETWHMLASRHVKLARDAGALSELPLAVRSRILLHAHAGELAEGAALIAEAQVVADATGSQLAPYGATGVAAWRGREAEATELIQANMDGVTSRGEGRGVTSQYSAALLYNGLGYYDKALAAAELVCQYDDIGVLGWSLTELVEAAARSGQPARASDALRRLSETTRASGTDWALGTEARSRALLSEGETAENCYREAIERLGRTRMRPAVARAHLLFGEWLRRENRRRDARAELRTAHDLFTTMGIEAFAERARRELLATGDTVRKRTVQTASELTAQEAHIARLAVDGRTNVEIGAQLFLSTRTVEWHLSKVYGKLGVGSRRELRQALASLRQADPQA
jgi:DNA-binding CsgD family transcriptional regulator